MRKIYVAALLALALVIPNAAPVAAKCLLRPPAAGTFEHRVGFDSTNNINSISATLYAPLDLVQPNAADSVAMIELSNGAGVARVGVYKGNDRNWHRYIRVTSNNGSSLYYDRPLTTWASVHDGVPISIVKGSRGPGFPTWDITIDGQFVQVTYLAEFWEGRSVSMKFYTTNQSNQYFGWNQTANRYAWTAMRVNGAAYNPGSWSRNGFTPFGDESKIIGDAFYAWDTYCS